MKDKIKKVLLVLLAIYCIFLLLENPLTRVIVQFLAPIAAIAFLIYFFKNVVGKKKS